MKRGPNKKIVVTLEQLNKLFKNNETIEITSKFFRTEISDRIIKASGIVGVSSPSEDKEPAVEFKSSRPSVPQE